MTNEKELEPTYPDNWVELDSKAEFIREVEQEEYTRYITKHSAINANGFTEPEIRMLALTAAATAVAGLSIGTRTDQIGEVTISVAKDFEKYLRGE